MPRIFDNIDLLLSQGLHQVLDDAVSCSFCIGYFNLRGWREVADRIEHLRGGSEDQACRVLVGMQRPPEEDMKILYGIVRQSLEPDGPSLARVKKRITEHFKKQLEFGLPTEDAERSLRKLANQLRARKVVLKAFLRYPLHAKLYLVRRADPVTPLIAFVGSSNLTLAGLSRQGELNVDVVEQDAAQKLLAWFDDRWRDELALDLTDELATLIEHSWACADRVRPYLVYLKIAAHLCEEARRGEREIRLPKMFQQVLLDFQAAAVSLVVQLLHRRGGVLLGDVVGLGKTLMATAVARILQEDDDSNTLVICPPKLEPLWDWHLQQYQINGRVLSLGQVIERLPDCPRYRLVIIDESHNLRNRESQRYRVIREYIEHNEPRVLLLSATPYNKHFTDLSNQLRLFVDEHQDLRIRPECFFQQWMAQGKTEADFVAQYQTSTRSLRAFEQSPFPEDWRDLMRLFLVRRTRQFIIKHYARFDETRQRYYVHMDGRPVYFPLRKPQRVEYEMAENNPRDQYGRLFRDDVVEVIETLTLPRYGLAKYLVPNAERLATPEERRILDNLNRAGRRLIGFCRTNLFKRLESSGYSFLLSVERHIVRNLVARYALENGLPLPIGAQDPARLDPALNDADDDASAEPGTTPESIESCELVSDMPEDRFAHYQSRVPEIYRMYQQSCYDRLEWLPAKFFRPDLATALLDDVRLLLKVLDGAYPWNPEADLKLARLEELLTKTHAQDKVLVFTQFADTAHYLGTQLSGRGVTDLAVVTNETPNPVDLARRFSPNTNGGLRSGESELRVLLATDVLAEGQNLQDAHIVVNYDLPWAIIRLIQRAGRVDRIGQQHDTITVYSFMPVEGIERIIRLRSRLFHRLKQNQEILGTDESFFGEEAANKLRDLYTEKAGILDEDEKDGDIDLSSLALQVWSSASEEDQKDALALPNMVHAARALPDTYDPVQNPPGVITYLRFPEGTDALVRVDTKGNLVSQSISSIFRAAACAPDTPALQGPEGQLDLVGRCAEIAAKERFFLGGQLGSLRSVRRKLWDRLDRYLKQQQANRTLFSAQIIAQLVYVLDLIWRFPLKRAAQDAISRQMRLGISDEALLELVYRRAEEGMLCEMTEAEPNQPEEPSIICSLGLVAPRVGDDPASPPTGRLT